VVSGSGADTNEVAELKRKLAAECARRRADDERKQAEANVQKAQQKAHAHIAELDALGLPKCDDHLLKEQLPSTVRNSPAGRTYGLELIATKDNAEIDYGADPRGTQLLGAMFGDSDLTTLAFKPHARYCTAMGYFNNGSRHMLYTVEVLEGDQLFINIEVQLH
jgi:hypothetical protein